MVHSLYLNSLCWDTLWTYKGKEVQRVYVPGEASYRAYSEGGGSPYTGGGYTGGGSYCGYSGDEGHRRGYGGVYGEGYSISCKKMYDKRFGADQKLVI